MHVSLTRARVSLTRGASSYDQGMCLGLLNVIPGLKTRTLYPSQIFPLMRFLNLFAKLVLRFKFFTRSSVGSLDTKLLIESIEDSV